jgi:hypothetical protein
MLLDGRTMNESVVPYQLGNGMDLGTEIEIAREPHVREADPELPPADVVAVLKDPLVLSTSIGTYLALRAAEVVVAKARPFEAQHASVIGVVAETGIAIAIEIRTETLDVLGMRRSLVVGVGREAGVVGEIGIGIGTGRRLGAGVAVLM